MNTKTGPSYSLGDRLWLILKTDGQFKFAMLLLIAGIAGIASQSVVFGLKAAGWTAICYVPVAYGLKWFGQSRRARRGGELR